MAITVYYGHTDNILGFDLEPVRDYINKNILNTPGMKKTLLISCPAFKDEIHNTFVVKSIYDYNIEWDGEKITSPMHDQDFFNRFLNIRSASDGFISYLSPTPIFVAESNDLIMSQINAQFHDNDIVNKCIMTPGTFNIGKHLPRKLELAIKFKQPGEIKIREGDALYYVKFHTKEKIIFKKFIWSEELEMLTNKNLQIRTFTRDIKSLQWWYNFMSRHKLKNYYLKRIKQHLI